MSESSSKYPRGRPFQPPEPETVDRLAPDDSPAKPRYTSDAQLRAWTLRMAVGIVGSVALVAAVAVFGLVVVLKPAAAPRAVAKAAATKPMPPTTAIPPVAVVPPRRPRVAEEEEPKAPQLPLPAPSPKVPAPVDGEKMDLALQTVGSLTVAHIYQTYINLFLLADAFERGIYPDADAKKLLATITAMIDTVDGQLAKLAQGGLEPEDRRRLERIRGSAALLRSQATELRAYCETPAADKAARKEHQAKFHRAREETWTAIKELLGTKDGPAPP